MMPQPGQMLRWLLGLTAPVDDVDRALRWAARLLVFVALCGGVALGAVLIYAVGLAS